MEAVASITILAVALPPTVSLFTQVAASTPDDILQRAALLSADALLEEIISKGFEEPDLPSGSFGTEEASRRLFDDIDDFDGLVESPPVHADGTAVEGQAGLARSVTVSNVRFSGPDQATPEADGSTELKRIEVKVTWTGGRGGELSLVTLRSHLTSSTDVSGPLDGPGSSGTAVNNDDDKFELLFINTTPFDQEIESFELEADRPTPQVDRFKLAADLGGSKDIWKGRASLPTGLLNLNKGKADQREIDAHGAAGARFEFRGDISPGPITFTLTLRFVGGATSTLVIPMVWQS